MIYLQSNVALIGMSFGMEIKHLQLFLHLAGSLHFAKTAEAMFVSPSALSRIVQKLEDECGVALFERDNRRVTLTTAGQTFREFSQSVVTQWQQARQNMDEQSALLQGELNIFCSVTASFSHLPALLDKFKVNYPHVAIKLVTGDPAQALEKVVSGQVDVSIAVNSSQLNDKHCHFVAIDQLPMVLISPAADVYTSIDDIDWQQQQLIRPETGHTRDALERWLKERNINPNIYATVAGNEAIVSMVALGCGIGIVPKVVVDNIQLQTRINVYPLPDIPYLELGVCCLKQKQQLPVVQALLRQLSTAN